MDWDPVLRTVTQVLILPAIPLIYLLFRTVVMKYVQKIEKELENKELEALKEYLYIVEGMVMSAVLSVKQTYADVLKEDGAWSVDRQKEAFSIAKEKVIRQLTEDGRTLLEKGLNDYESYIEDLIESFVITFADSDEE